MYLERLELEDYRSYPGANLDLQPGVSLFLGPNAQGKTNLLEAVHYLSVGRSHRVTGDGPLVRQGAEAAVLRAGARMTAGVDEGPGRRVAVELELRPAGRNRIRVNGQPQRRTRDGIGLIRSVQFAPEDLRLVRGDPAERRRFLDDLLGQRRRAYLGLRQDYERVLRQRNALLKDVRADRHRRGPAGQESGAGVATELETWTDALVASASMVLAARIAVVHALAGPTARAYRDLVATSPDEPGQDVILAYKLSTGRTVVGTSVKGVPDPAELAEELRDGLSAVAPAERERGLTLAGPHRDDLELHLGDLPAKGYASHGESWSLALALRLASREVLADVGEEPVVLLDDVFAELDEHRRGQLALRCRSFEQVLVTAAVAGDVPLGGRRFDVRRGMLLRADAA